MNKSEYRNTGSANNDKKKTTMYTPRSETMADFQTLIDTYIAPIFRVANELVSSYSELSAAIGRAPTDGTLYIIEVTEDILNFTSALTIASGKNIIIVSDISGPWSLTKSTTGFHFIANGTLTLENIVLDGNWDGISTSRYGGIDVYGIFYLNDGAVIQNCNASNSPSDAATGGGLTGRPGSTITVNGGIIRNNRKFNTNGGGGVYVSGAGTSFTMNSGIINGNLASSPSTGYGGGICGTISSSITINGGTISGNTAATNGGGVFAGNGVMFNMTGGTVIGNESLGAETSAGHGGGICINSTTAAATTIINISNSLINGNKTPASEGSGGGVYVNLSATTDFSVLITGSTISANESANGGGGIYVTSSNTARATIIINDSEISSNITHGSGGGIYGGSYSTIEVSDSKIDNNEANVSASTSNGGGGIFGGTYSNITINSSTADGNTINGNITTSYGGGIFNHTGATTAINGGTVSSNATTSNGGGIFVNSSSAAPGTIIVNGGTISGNSASSGGGIYGYTSSIVTASGGIISSNTAASNGGGIFGSSGSTIMVSGDAEIGGDSAFYSNRATNGGGVYTLGSFSMTGGAIKSNAANDGGGVFMAANTAFILSGGVIIGNTGTRNGGGVNMSLGTLIMSDSVINGNVAGSNGGGIYLTASAALEIIGAGFITDNSAPNGNGGGIYTANTAYTNLTTASDTVFMGNAASLPYVPPVNAVILYPNIGFASTSIANHPLNNYDINFTSGEILTYYITYDANGGVGNYTGPGILPGGTDTVLSPNDIGIFRLGYIFTGWNTEPTGGGTPYEPGDVITLNSNVTLYAQWTTANLYTVTYDANGGAGGRVDRDIPYGTEYVILSPEEAEISRLGYTFTDWNTEPDGSGTSFTPGNVITITDNVILYAHWQVNLFTVTYLANGGVGNRVDTVPYSTQYVILSPEEAGISRLGYTFTGWNTEPDGSGTSFAPGNVIIITGSVVLYARWQVNLFSITYNANGGVGERVDTAPYGAEYIILSPEQAGISRSGYTFISWNTEPDGNGTAYEPGSVITITANVILYAQWEVNLFTVTYNANGGVGSRMDTGIPYGAEYIILSPEQAVISRPGYTFISWNTESGGSGTAYEPSDIITITGNIILYAQWEVNLFTVTYNANGGVGSRVDTGISYGAEYMILSTEQAGISRPGYTFISWNTEPDGNGMSFTPGEVIIITGNIILYAQWKINVFSVNYLANGGVGSRVDTVPYGAKYMILSPKEAKISHLGYTFINWNTRPDGSGTAYAPGEVLIITDNINLYAQWKENIVIICKPRSKSRRRRYLRKKIFTICILLLL